MSEKIVNAADSITIAGLMLKFGIGSLIVISVFDVMLYNGQAIANPAVYAPRLKSESHLGILPRPILEVR